MRRRPVESIVPETFNALAEARGWSNRCSPVAQLRDRFLIDLLAVWQGLAQGAIPPRRAFTARALKPFLRDIAIFEQVARQPPRYRARLVGTGLAAITGDLQGAIIDEKLPPDITARWHASLDAVLRAGAPLRFTVANVAFGGLSHLQAELLAAPMTDDAGAATMVLAGIVLERTQNPVPLKP
ncbi:MAG: PAS domain-containing protein [Alphaproteobacteria bacterium]|nr:PAS domain-containing protein [Alphaproteobacteria bacterium]